MGCMRELVSSSTIKDNRLGLLNQQSTLWMAIQLPHNSIYNCWKAKSLPKEWTFEQARVLINGTKHPHNNPHIDSFSLHKLSLLLCLVSKIPHIWIV